MTIFDQYTDQYSLSKTLRFELKPIGETEKKLGEILETDRQRAEAYKEIKPLIDDLHRDYIEKKLSDKTLFKPDNFEDHEASKKKQKDKALFKPDHFEHAFQDFKNFADNPRNQNSKKIWQKRQDVLRKTLVKAFVDNKGLFKKELITKHLPKYLETQGTWEKHKNAVETFNRFTTYFTGFHENRKNMYSHEDQSTAISHRLMNENLPRFFRNCLDYQKLERKYPDLPLQPEDTEIVNRMGVSTLDDIFQPGYFINLLTQSDIDKYNELLGGRSEEDGLKIQGLNEKINQYRQKHNLKVRDCPGFMRLYKQILSDRETASFVPEAFEGDRQLLETLEKYIEKATSPGGMICELQQAVKKLSDADIEKVYVKTAEIRTLSQAMFGSYGIIPTSLEWYAENVEHPALANNKLTDTLVKKRRKYIEQEVFSVAQLDKILSCYVNQLDTDDPLHRKLESYTKSQPVLSHLIGALETSQANAKLDETIEQVKPLLELKKLNKRRVAPKTSDNKADKGSEGFQQVQKIQGMMDAFMALADSVKPLHLVQGRKPLNVPDMDSGFYADFSESFKEYRDLTIGLYNKIRNHLTKKPFSVEKMKLNFDNSTLLDGWDVNKEEDNTCVILRKDKDYFLGVMGTSNRKLFAGELPKSKNCYQKMTYKLLPGASKMLPKVFFSNSHIRFYNPSEEILRIRNTASHTKNGTPREGHSKAEFCVDDMRQMIDFFKQSIRKHPEWSSFNFNFSSTEDFEDISDFYKEVEHQGYRITWQDVSQEYINQCVKEGKLFLFQIYNKDFSTRSKGKPNLHTLYWRGLFESKNLEDVVLKLNGQAEVFYRKHSIDSNEAVKHKANEAIDNKNSENPKKTSTFQYDIIKDRRYTQDKFLFHVPITLNFQATTGVANFNDRINQTLSANEDTHIIGIDRGERHLLYYTVINQSGEIVKQDTLNRISTDQNYTVDYQEKLDNREKERDKARKSWSSVENIKQLKAGYLSYVVHEISKLVIEYNAIVCLEDLNFGFKHGRFKVEKQVYQNFEKALISKLNYLVFKDKAAKEAGGYLKGYQLTAPFKSFEKLGKQSGILFYVQAAYTSKIDPVTGFIDFLRPKYESLAKSKTFFESMDSIQFNTEEKYFEFAFDYRKMQPNRKMTGYKTKWVICTHGDTRYQNKRNDKGNWQTEKVNVTKEIRALFDNAGIEYINGNDLKEAIASRKDTKFYKKLFRLLNITLSLRHSISGTEKDFILSPVAGGSGRFFDSRNASKDQPKDADGNGAYHIALKGLWNLQQIKKWNGKDRLNLAMTMEDWLQFIAKIKQNG